MSTAWFFALRAAGERADRVVRASWTAEADQTVLSGPDWFYYDAGRQELVARGAINEDAKSEVLELLVTEDGPVGSFDSSGSTFRQAVDVLAFRSNDEALDALLFLLLAGAFSGALGGVLRAVGNFVGNACYKPEQWDAARWWPLYASRPLLGFMFGLVLILVVSAGLLSIEDPRSSSVLWWLAIAFLAGFGSNEFQERLRAIAKAIFGETARKGPSPESGAAQPEPTDDQGRLGDDDQSLRDRSANEDQAVGGAGASRAGEAQEDAPAPMSPDQVESQASDQQGGRR